LRRSHFAHRHLLVRAKTWFSRQHNSQSQKP
jgi:hypothetical protein